MSNMQTIAQMEAELIEKTMKKFNGNKTQAALSLGISVPKLYAKLKEYWMTEYYLPVTPGPVWLKPTVRLIKTKTECDGCRDFYQGVVTTHDCYCQ